MVAFGCSAPQFVATYRTRGCLFLTSCLVLLCVVMFSRFICLLFSASCPLPFQYAPKVWAKVLLLLTAAQSRRGRLSRQVFVCSPRGLCCINFYRPQASPFPIANGELATPCVSPNCPYFHVVLLLHTCSHVRCRVLLCRWGYTMDRSSAGIASGDRGIPCSVLEVATTLGRKPRHSVEGREHAMARGEKARLEIDYACYDGVQPQMPVGRRKPMVAKKQHVRQLCHIWFLWSLSSRPSRDALLEVVY